MKTFLSILICMIFCHIIDDYVLQAFCLNKLKQKSFWKENAPDELYKYDYIVALLVHGFSWSFMIQLPILLYYKFDISWNFFVLLFINICMHAFIDDQKANRNTINLWYDQTCHLCQIITALIILLKI